MPRRSVDGLRYSSAAVRALRAQLEHYAKATPGTEFLFVEAVRQAEALALGNPEGFARVRWNTELRSIGVRRFPFRLFYVLRGRFVVVAAIVHTSRSIEALLKHRPD